MADHLFITHLFNGSKLDEWTVRSLGSTQSAVGPQVRQARLICMYPSGYLNNCQDATPSMPLEWSAVLALPASFQANME